MRTTALPGVAAKRLVNLRTACLPHWCLHWEECAVMSNRELVSFLSVYDFGLFFNGDSERQKRGGKSGGAVHRAKERATPS